MRKTHLIISSALATLVWAGCSEEEAPEVVEEVAPEAAPVAEPEPEPEPKPAKRFLEVTGEVTVDGKPAAVDMEIGDTSEVKTGKGARAVITLGLGDNSVIEVRESSHFKLGTSKRKKTSLRLLLGAVWSFVADGASYEVETNNAVAGVRGTVFYVEANSKKKSYICACDGDIDIVGKNPKLKKKLESSMEHKAFYVNTKGKKQKAKKAKRERHTEEQKMALASYTMPAAADEEGGVEDDDEGDDEEEPAE